MKEDADLDANIEDLNVSTRARNKAFQNRLDEIWSLTHTWESHLNIEKKEATETIMDMREDYQKQLNNLNSSLQNQIKRTFDKFDYEILAADGEHVKQIEDSFNMFVKEIVPENIEKHSGEVSRQLRRAYETFDIEKIKEEKRETKLVEKANRHLQLTAQRFEDENAMLNSSFYNIDDEIVQEEARSARQHLIRNEAAFKCIKLLNDTAKEEREKRTSEDIDLLDTIIDTQQLLQKTILTHFGTSTEGKEEVPSFDKLKARMARVGEMENDGEQHTDENDRKEVDSAT